MLFIHRGDFWLGSLGCGKLIFGIGGLPEPLNLRRPQFWFCWGCVGLVGDGLGGGDLEGVFTLGELSGFRLLEPIFLLNRLV